MMKSRLVPYICYLIIYNLLYDTVTQRNRISFMERFVSLERKISQQNYCMWISIFKESSNYRQIKLHPS